MTPEVMYLVRRSDGEHMDDDNFLWIHVDGPDDWDAAVMDAETAPEPIEYEIVRASLEVVGRRMLPTCKECDAPATHWGLCEAHAREDDPTAFDPEDPS